MNYLRGLGGGAGASAPAQLTDDYSLVDGGSVQSGSNLLGGTPRGRNDGGRSFQGGNRGNTNGGGGIPANQGGFGHGGIPTEIHNDGAIDDGSQVTGPNIPGGGDQGPGAGGGVEGSTSTSLTRPSKAGPPIRGGAHSQGGGSRLGSHKSPPATRTPSSSASSSGRGRSKATKQSARRSAIKP